MYTNGTKVFVSVLMKLHTFWELVKNIKYTPPTESEFVEEKKNVQQQQQHQGEQERGVEKVVRGLCPARD